MDIINIVLSYLSNMVNIHVVSVIALGIVAGFLSSLVGIGWGIIIVPALILWFGFSQHQAQGTSLALLSIPVSFVAVSHYHSKGMVDRKLACILAFGFVIGGLMGSKVALSLPEFLLRRVFAIIMIIIALNLLIMDQR